jgi:ubiquinone/menaquinone biosynthesis C-methylase UbiE/ADP-ribose pyrophosphatase YjhB (NUDIX family)
MIDDSWYARPTGAPVHELAGGIVLRLEDGRVLVALIREGAGAGYSLPKGHREPGETLEAAAQREVAEEAGLRELDTISLLGTRERLNFTKRAWNITHYFVFRAPADERGTAEWFPLDALPAMFWPEQRELIEVHRGRLDSTARKYAVRLQFARRAGAYAGSASHAWDDDLALLIERLDPQPSDRVLDVATGTGFTARAVAPLAAMTVGVDFTRRMLQEARVVARERETIQWVEGDAEALPFASGAFSMVVVRRAPHHFPHVDAAVREMLRVTEPDGRIGIVDQIPPDDPGGAILMETLERLRDPSHVRALPPEEWQDLVSASGGTVEFATVVEQPMSFARWMELAGADAARARRIEAVLARAAPETRARIGDTGDRPRMFLKRWIVLTARKPRTTR